MKHKSLNKIIPFLAIGLLTLLGQTIMAAEPDEVKLYLVNNTRDYDIYLTDVQLYYSSTPGSDYEQPTEFTKDNPVTPGLKVDPAHWGNRAPGSFGETSTAVLHLVDRKTQVDTPITITLEAARSQPINLNLGEHFFSIDVSSAYQGTWSGHWISSNQKVYDHTITVTQK